MSSQQTERIPHRLVLLAFHKQCGCHWMDAGVGSQTLRCHCCFDLHMATITDGPANLLVFASYTSNKTVNGLCSTFTDQHEPDTGSFGASPEDVIVLRGLEQEVLTCVNNSVAVAILFSFSTKTSCFLALLCQPCHS